MSRLSVRASARRTSARFGRLPSDRPESWRTPCGARRRQLQRRHRCVGAFFVVLAHTPCCVPTLLTGSCLLLVLVSLQDAKDAASKAKLLAKSKQDDHAKKLDFLTRALREEERKKLEAVRVLSCEVDAMSRVSACAHCAACVFVRVLARCRASASVARPRRRSSQLALPCCEGDMTPCRACCRSSWTTRLRLRCGCAMARVPGEGRGSNGAAKGLSVYLTGVSRCCLCHMCVRTV